MATAEKPAAIPTADMAELEKAVQDLMKGIRDPAKVRQTAEEMDPHAGSDLSTHRPR